MSKREDLERLAGECEACALRDSDSIDNHMITCPSCVDHRLKAEEIDEQVKEVRALSTVPEVERRHLIGYDVNDILNMTDAQRIDVLKDMFDNLADLNEAERTVLVKTRTDIITSLPKTERDRMMASAREIYSSYDVNRKIAEEQAILAATEDYSPLKRTMVRRMYRRFMR